jgi:ketosteroid isomerase-like protein
MSVQRRDREALAADLVSAFNERDVERIEGMTTPDVVVRFQPGQVFHGHPGLRQFKAEMDRLAPDFTLAALRTYTGDDHVVIEWENRLVTRRNRELDELGVVILVMEGDKISRVHLYFDPAAWRAAAADAAHG